MYLRNLFRIFLGFLATGLISTWAQPGQRPNIIILFADDMGYGDLTHTGHPTIRTPNLDRMAREGLRMTNFYSGSPACTASRYALLTGKYPARSGFGWVLYPKSPRGIHPNEVTLAEGLKASGYATACFGKWHLGSTQKEYLPLQNGFDSYLGLPYSNDMIPPKWESIPLLSGNDTLELDPDQSRLTELYTQHAIDFIRDKQDQSFFVYLPYAMPHLPLHPGPDFRGRSVRGLYGDVIEEIDASVGAIMDSLASFGLSGRTLVLFTSDNGPWIIKGIQGGSSGLFRDGKGSTWEGGMRVPAIAWWPGTIPSGSLTMRPASVLDVYYTVMKLGGGTLPSDSPLDGKDLSPLLTSPEGEEGERPFYYHGPGNALHAVRKGKWKLHIKTSSQTGIQYFEGKLPLLFNLEEDPSENHDLSDRFPSVVAELQTLLEKYQHDLTERSNYFDNSEKDRNK